MFRRTQLQNGITVVTEQMKNMHTVALGIWVKAGSRHENPDLNGLSHFIEHMFFKGTKTRTARAIAIEIDSIGGELNAFTTKEGTTYYIKVLDEHLKKGSDILLDIFLNSTFPSKEIEREKEVVKEEIKMVEDTPDEHIHDLFGTTVWGKQGIGQTVLGNKLIISSFSRKDIKNYINNYYGTDDIIVACAGNFDEKMLLDKLNSGLGKLKRPSTKRDFQVPVFRESTSVIKKNLSEVHLCIGLNGIRQASPDRYALLLLNTVLGGGISSRLFQEIREKRGLAYTVYSFLSSYVDAGVWGVYAGTGKTKADEVIKRTLDTIFGLSKTLKHDELNRAKDQLKGSLILGLESTSRRMQNIANQQIYYGRHYTPEEIIKAIDSVTMDEAKALIMRLTSTGGYALTALGPADKRLGSSFTKIQSN